MTSIYPYFPFLVPYSQNFVKNRFLKRHRFKAVFKKTLEPRSGSSEIIYKNYWNANPPVLTLRRDETERMIKVGDAESLMLWPQGVTDGLDTPMGLSRDIRMKMIGNAICGHHLREIMHMWRIPTHLERVVNNISASRANATQTQTGPDPAKVTWKQLEHELSAMTDKELGGWIPYRSKGYLLPELDLEVEEGMQWTVCETWHILSHTCWTV